MVYLLHTRLGDLLWEHERCHGIQEMHVKVAKRMGTSEGPGEVVAVKGKILPSGRRNRHSQSPIRKE